jgi:aminoglycoside phosphotransferase
MTGLDENLQQWVAQIVAPGAHIVEVRGLRQGGSPWLVRLHHNDQSLQVIVRVGRPENRLQFETESAALELVAAHGIAAPKLLATNLVSDPPRMLIECLDGSSRIPFETSVPHLRGLGAAAASLNRLQIAPSPALPVRDRPIAGVDFAALRREHSTALLREVELRVAEHTTEYPIGFVHGDLWQGNTLWDGDRLVGLIDWDCAGVGPGGVDLGSLRCDAAVCFGLRAAEHVLRGWEDAAVATQQLDAGGVAHWDLVAGLCTPPDIAWFAETIADQGRPDLSRSLLLSRRDEFLEAALAQSSAT